MKVLIVFLFFLLTGCNLTTTPNTALDSQPDAGAATDAAFADCLEQE